jgi:hypothetical protein
VPYPAVPALLLTPFHDTFLLSAAVLVDGEQGQPLPLDHIMPTLPHIPTTTATLVHANLGLPGTSDLSETFPSGQ